MTDTFVALLRGINVGGKHKLPMKDLARLFEDHGGTEVQTYIQSGNVVYRASEGQAATIATAVAASIEAEFGFAVPIVLRSAAALSQIVDGNPFLAEGAEEPTLHVALLAERPTRAAVAALDPERSPPDRFEVRGQEIYLWCPNGLARTKLTNAYFDRALATTCTVRNWRTTQKLHAMTSS